MKKKNGINDKIEMRENSEKTIEEVNETDTGTYAARTESTSMEGTKENEDSGLRRNEAGQAQASEYPVRPGVIDCKHYMITGQCGYGGSCIFNHPPRQIRHETVQSSPYPVRPGATDCKHYLITGYCGYGSDCYFNHPPPTLLALEVPERINIDTQATTSDLRFDERRHETEERAITIPDSPEYVSDDDIFAGYKRVRIEQGEENIGWQRMEAQEIVEEQRERQSIWLQRRQAQENVQRENIEGLQRRETEEESLEERRLREMHPQVLDNVEEERQRDIQRQRREAKSRIEKIKATVQFDEVRMKELGFRVPVFETQSRKDLHKQILKNIEERRQREAEERRKDIERQRSESRMKLEQMKSTVEFDEWIQIREALPELGITKKEGDGF